MLSFIIGLFGGAFLMSVWHEGKLRANDERWKRLLAEVLSLRIKMEFIEEVKDDADWWKNN